MNAANMTSKQIRSLACRLIEAGARARIARKSTSVIDNGLASVYLVTGKDAQWYTPAAIARHHALINAAVASIGG
jgi:hypothetical protein